VVSMDSGEETSRLRRLSERGPGWFAAGAVTRIIGLLVYATGFFAWAYSNHKILCWNLGDDLSAWTRMNERGSYVEGAGVAVTMLGLAFIAIGLARKY
jgi:hypothetical protein